MRYGKWFKLLLCALLMVLALAGAAMAEEEVTEVRVELYHEGGFPEEQPRLYSMFGMNTFDDYMIEQLNAQASEIPVKDFGLTQDKLFVEYQRLLNANPELFFVYGGYTLYTSGGMPTKILPQYYYYGAELAQMQSIYEAGVARVVRYAKTADTDVGRMLRASDYLCANYSYDMSVYDDPHYAIYRPELFFRDGTGVCQAYMLAYRAVLNELGIPNITVSSKEINHTWNMVYLDDAWYHIDVTWNDPTTDVPLRAKHNNFLLSDSAITATGHKGWDDSWEVVVPADSTKYDNYWWIGVNQVIPMLGDVAYYVSADYTSSRDSRICSFDLATEEQNVEFTFKFTGMRYFPGYYPLWVTRDAFYFAMLDKLYGVPASGGTAVELFNTGNSSVYIFCPYAAGGSETGSALQVYLSDHPQKPGVVKTLSLSSPRGLTLDQTEVYLNLNNSVQLTATVSPEPTGEYEIVWSTSDESVVTVEDGLVTAVGPGIAEITAEYDIGVYATCRVFVWDDGYLVLPADMIHIEEEAFAGTQVSAYELPEGLETIGKRAFADNWSLEQVILPDSLESIADDAFEGCVDLLLICREGTFGETYAKAKQIPYIIVP